MKTRISLATVLLLTVVASASAKDDITKELITANGKTRAYYLYVPSTVKASAPLLVTLHGSNRNGITLVEKWKDYAKKEGIILVGPDSSNPRGWGSPQDGPDFLHDLIEELKTKHPINPRRVYLFGHSAGGSFSLNMALLESQYFAAAAVHAGALSNLDIIEQATRKIPISIQIGDSDALVPLNVVRATSNALKEAGFIVDMIEIANHDHWYYDKASKFNQTAWEFMKKYELDSDPQYKKYNFNR